MSATPLDNLAGLRYLLLNEVFTLSHLVIVKLMGIEFASVQIVFIRCLSSAVLLVPLLARQGSLGEVRTRLGLNSLRVLLSSVAITIHFFTISQIQLAQMSTIGYLRPAVTSLIAYFFLKESQSWHRWMVIVIGFAAVLFIFSPESGHLQIVALLALFAHLRLAARLRRCSLLRAAAASGGSVARGAAAGRAPPWFGGLPRTITVAVFPLGAQ